jgi:GTP cyclohydrolase I
VGVKTYGYDELNSLAIACASSIHAYFGDRAMRTLAVYPVPRGGVPATLALLGTSLSLLIVDDPDNCDFIMDDLIDTGSTMERFRDYEKPFFALVDKRGWPHDNDWIVWPWEGDSIGGIEDNIRRLIQFAGDDPTRGGMIETPARVAKAWKHWCSGYDVDPASLLKTFEDGAEGAKEMVLVRNIPFYSHCEHHMAPFFGTATVGYIPNGRIVGLSKLNRLVECFARRFQVQERMTTQIADAIAEHLQPLGVGVIVTARHMCVESRGVAHHGSETTTSALRGVMTEGKQRQEFLLLAK